MPFNGLWQTDIQVHTAYLWPKHRHTKCCSRYMPIFIILELASQLLLDTSYKILWLPHGPLKTRNKIAQQELRHIQDCTSPEWQKGLAETESQKTCCSASIALGREKFEQRRRSQSSVALRWCKLLYALTSAETNEKKKTVWFCMLIYINFSRKKCASAMIYMLLSFIVR